ncbi:MULTISPECIES: hypothetical protein [unclassified Pedobacter]|uniref:hypothetical protein n=1 Tax=unclassified Pedobacter TaxID=2628915 RepID=UPI0014209872|nr:MULTISPECIES: hypothetical protein [unclassified Pedobacter]NII81682.1 hypothetical protein [Pedobacter sp. SG908]NMN35686.1 hypothetical protein [Pedobacter sp. SG918]
MTKKEQSAIRLGIINRVFSAVMHILEESHIYGTDLWPVNGFKAGAWPDLDENGIYKYDTINIYIIAQAEPAMYKVRFNNWNTSEQRIVDQTNQMLLIFGDAVYDNIHFTMEYPEQENDLWLIRNGDELCGYLDYKYTIQ